MAFVGIAVRISKGRPHLRGVFLDEPSTGEVRTFDFLPASGLEVADMIHSVADGLAGQFAASTSEVVRVVIRQADDGERGGMTGARLLRARTEGAAAYVARNECSDVRILNGPAVGRACGGDRSDAEDQASRIVASEWVVAGSAALAAKNL